MRAIQLMRGHADLKQTERCLKVTDEELRKTMPAVWARRGGPGHAAVSAKCQPRRANMARPARLRSSRLRRARQDSTTLAASEARRGVS